MYSGEAIIFIQPKGKQRPRMTKSGHTYTPKTTRAYEQFLADELRCDDFEKIPKDVPLFVGIICGFKPPKGQENLVGLPRPKNPDLDNLQKSVYDAMEKAYILENDKCITTSMAKKIYASEDFVKVAWMEDDGTTDGHHDGE